jgi:iron-sulfur cluster repair protein YtfE (RIC family)
MAKRHPSLHSLSHDHHHTLALAQRLVLGDAALLDDGWTHDTLEQARRVQTFAEDELNKHFAAEEQVLFPAAVRHSAAAAALIPLLTGQHRTIETLVADLAEAHALERARLLVRLGELLQEHVRAEERELFPLCQDAIPEPELHAAGLQMEALRREQKGGARESRGFARRNMP